jgi:sugar phosphate isomerase/epimerase
MDRRMGTMKIGINTYPFLWTAPLNEAFQKVKQLGFHEIEILTSPPFFPLSEHERVNPSEFNRLVEQAGVHIHSLNIPGQDINLASPFEEMRQFTVNQYRKLIEFAEQTNTPYIVMPPGRLHPLLPPDFEWVWKITKPHLEELIEYAEKKGVTLLIENIPSLFLQTAEQIQWVTEEVKSDHFAVIYDVANGFMVENPVEGIYRLKDKIKLIHLSDTTKEKWGHNVIGSGSVDFESIYTALSTIEYEGLCMLEIIHPEAESGILTSVEQLKQKGWVIDNL